MNPPCLVRWAIVWTAIAGFTACAARSHPAPAITEARCAADAVDSCRSRCGGGAAPDPHSHEGRCEQVLHDVCRAHCSEGCATASEEERKRLEALESRLNHDCGSGESMEPGGEPPSKAPPTPNPVERLMM
jgi:hypothetical protein